MPVVDDERQMTRMAPRRIAKPWGGRAAGRQWPGGPREDEAAPRRGMRAFGDRRRAVLRASHRGRESGEGLPDDKYAKMVEALEHTAQVIDSL